MDEREASLQNETEKMKRQTKEKESNGDLLEPNEKKGSKPHDTISFHYRKASLANQMTGNDSYKHNSSLGACVDLFPIRVFLCIHAFYAFIEYTENLAAGAAHWSFTFFTYSFLMLNCFAI